jgi:phosphoglycolate phosphatase-like HAD superfamily hydrolase
MAEKVIVFDIDGTLANSQHRMHWVSSKPKNWRACDAAIPQDTVFEDIRWLLHSLSSNRIIICTGRSESTRKVTEQWLADNDISYSALYMRKEGDYRKDSIIKAELLYQIMFDYSKPYLWFDDRQQVVDAIRAEGIRVLQVAPGDF